MRETAAQALGAAARPLAPASLPPLLAALRQLSEHPMEWEVRHGGLLGLKYVLAARAEGVDAPLLEAVLPATIVGLQVGVRPAGSPPTPAMCSLWAAEPSAGLADCSLQLQHPPPSPS